MKETRIVACNLGASRVDIAQRLLTKLALLDAATLTRTGFMAGMLSVSLRPGDSRLPALIRELESLGEAPSVRAQRSYTERDLDAFEWVLLRIRTAGLLGSMNLEQAYDRSHACATCGAGALPVPPLLAHLGAMGRKALDATAHDDQIVVTRELANSIREASLSGAEFLDVSPGSGRVPSDRFRWLHIAGCWPPFSPSSIVVTDDLCTTCGRAGHYDAHDRVTELRYDHYPQHAPDFNRTSEHFGVWRLPRQSSQRPVGGGRFTIVSQRVRRLFRESKVRNISFEPVVSCQPSGESGAVQTGG